MRNFSKHAVGYTKGSAKDYHSHIGARDFVGNVSWKGALDLFEKGWTEGREKLVAMAADSGKVDLEVAPAVSLDVAGYRPDVPLFLTGEPACMQQATEQRSKPFLRILFSASYSCRQDETVMNYGIGLASMIKAFDWAGYSTGVIAEFTSADRHDSDPKRCNRLDLVLKTAGQRLDIDRLAFVCCHKAMLRRLKFAWMETRFMQRSSETYGSYGHTITPTEAEADIVIPSIDNNMEAAESVESAVAYFERVAAGHLSGKSVTDTGRQREVA